MKFKVGDLIHDRDFPEDGFALVLEVREPDRRNKHWEMENCYRCYELTTQKINWYHIGYVEQECAFVTVDTKCPGEKNSHG